MTKAKCPYTYPHRSRKAKVDFICGIGGYGSRDGRWPIEFTVSLDRANLDFDNLWEVMISQQLLTVPKGDYDLYRRVAQKVYKECSEHFWNWGQEELCDSLSNDTYKTLWDGTELRVELSLQGRSGKHLVIDSFEGMQLCGFSETALHDRLMTQYAPHCCTSDKDRLLWGGEWDIDIEVIDKLYKYCRQGVVDFTSLKASRELEYLSANQLAWRVEIGIDEERQQLAATRKLEDHAKLLYARMPKDGETIDSLYALCKAAGISPSELAAN